MRISCTAVLILVLIGSGQVFCKTNPSDSAQFDALLKTIETGNTYQRKKAVWQLAQIPDDRRTPTLIEMLKYEDIRPTIADCLGRLGDKSAADPLAKILRNSDFNTRQFAARALKQIGNQSNVPALTDVVTTGLPSINETNSSIYSILSALSAIGAISSAAPPEILALLDKIPYSDKDDLNEKWWKIIEAAAVCVGNTGDKTAWEQLSHANGRLSEYKHNYRTWYAVRKAMSQIEPDYAPLDNPVADILYQVRTFKMSRDSIRKKWTYPIAEMGTSAIEDLEWAIKFKSVSHRDNLGKTVAIEALGYIGGEEAADILREYIDTLKQTKDKKSLSNSFFLCDSLISYMIADPNVQNVEYVTESMAIPRHRQNQILHEIKRNTGDRIPTPVTIELCSQLISPQRPQGIEYHTSKLAAEYLAEFGGTQAGEALTQLLTNPNGKKLSADAVQALGNIKGYDPLPALTMASTLDHIPAGAIAKAVINQNSPDSENLLEILSARENLSTNDRLWIAAARVNMSIDYPENAQLIRNALPESLPQARFIPDSESIKKIAGYVSQPKYTNEALAALEAMNTPASLKAAFDALETSINNNMTVPIDSLNLITLFSNEAGIAKKLSKNEKEQYYRDIAEMTNMIRYWFIITQRAQSMPTDRSGFISITKYPELARAIWISETTKRLDLAAKKDSQHYEYDIPEWALTAIVKVFDPELIPVFERIVNESTEKNRYPGKTNYFDFYYLRSKAAQILTENTQKQYFFTDIDGQERPGGWKPSQM